MVRLLLWLAAAAAGARFGLLLGPAFSRPSHGFVAYYTASRLLAEGVDPALNYDVDWFMAQIARFQPDAADVHINPPPTNVLLLPLVGLDYTAARQVWSALSLLCLIVVVTWWMRRWRWQGAWLPLFLLLVFLFQPVWANFHLGQIYLFLLALLTAAWAAFRRRQDGRLGVILALAGVMKLAGAFVWLLPAVALRQRWRVFLWGSVAAAGLLLVTWPGRLAWEAYLALLAELSSQPERAVTAYQTWLSWSHHFFIYDAQWNPTPVAALPALADWLYGLGAAGMVGATAWLARAASRSSVPDADVIGAPDLLFAATVTLGVVLSPLALDYHYALLLLPVFILLQWMCQAYLARQAQQPAWYIGLLLLALLAVAADLPYRSPRLVEGWWALLAYPKLYGALLLWGLALWGSRRHVGE
ncbi:MAG: hypothetical protein Fur0021_39210 [Candidatus Promineifilaceae bacterium]